MRQLLISLVLVIIVLIAFVYIGAYQKKHTGSTQTSGIPLSKEDIQDASNSISDEVQSSCTTILSMVTAIPGIRIKQSEGIVHDLRYDRKGYGKIITLTGSTASFVKGKKPDMILREGLPAHGWKEDISYAADGPDGSSFALRNNRVFCMFQASWDGGDVSDPTYTPEDWYTLTIQCVLESTLQ